MKHKMKILVPVGFNEKPEELLDKAVSVAKKYMPQYMSFTSLQTCKIDLLL
jgi:hypothetical protein